MENPTGEQVTTQPAENVDVITGSSTGDSEDEGIVVARPVTRSPDLFEDNENRALLSRGNDEEQEMAMNVQNTAQTSTDMSRAVGEESNFSIWTRVKMHTCSCVHLPKPVMYCMLAVVVLATVLAYFAGMVGSPTRELGMRGGNVTRGISADDPRWPKLEQHLEQCNDQLRQTEDAQTISFFREASAAPTGDMQDAMNRYLYFAIMHAVVLGRSYSDTAVYAPGVKVGMSDVRTYLNVMLETMENEEIISKDALADQFREMNRYLYLTIVQAGVLRSSYHARGGEPLPPLPHDPNPEPLPPTPGHEKKPEGEQNDADEPKNEEKQIDHLKIELRNQREQVDKLTMELRNEKKQADHLTMELHNEKTRVDKLTMELHNEKTQVDKLAIELQYEKTQVDVLRMELLNERKQIGVLKTNLMTCTQKCNDCSKKLEGCQGDKVPNKTVSEPDGSGDYDDEEWVTE